MVNVKLANKDKPYLDPTRRYSVKGDAVVAVPSPPPPEIYDAIVGGKLLITNEEPRGTTVPSGAETGGNKLSASWKNPDRIYPRLDRESPDPNDWAGKPAIPAGGTSGSPYTQQTIVAGQAGHEAALEAEEREAEAALAAAQARVEAAKAAKQAQEKQQKAAEQEQAKQEKEAAKQAKESEKSEAEQKQEQAAAQEGDNTPLPSIKKLTPAEEAAEQKKAAESGAKSTQK